MIIAAADLRIVTNRRPERTNFTWVRVSVPVFKVVLRFHAGWPQERGSLSTRANSPSFLCDPLMRGILHHMADKDGPPTRREITMLLHLMAEGDKSAADELLRAIENELRKIASILLRRERPNHTLQTTALVNEALIRLLGTDGQWKDRQHFLSTASRAMRHVLVDYARRRRAPMIPLDFANPAIGPISARALDVHKALEELEAIAPRQAQLVELRFFGGLSLEEAAEILKIAPRTADKDWELARRWLEKRLASIGRTGSSA